MQDVVGIVLQAEAEAKRILEEAEAEAERLTSEARSRAHEIVQMRRREAAEEADAIVKSAEQDAQGEREERLARAAVEIEAAVQLDPSAARQLVDAVLSCVGGTK
jgi:vacuolar-type H+-ATPase subunit H